MLDNNDTTQTIDEQLTRIALICILRKTSLMVTHTFMDCREEKAVQVPGSWVNSRKSIYLPNRDGLKESHPLIIKSSYNIHSGQQITVIHQ
jgi:hypothetical protein